MVVGSSPTRGAAQPPFALTIQREGRFFLVHSRRLERAPCSSGRHARRRLLGAILVSSAVGLQHPKLNPAVLPSVSPRFRLGGRSIAALVGAILLGAANVSVAQSKPPRSKPRTAPHADTRTAAGGVAPAPTDTISAHLISGRNAHDKTSYASAVRSGTKMAAKWPPGPAPLPGAVFPAKRVVAFYGNPLAKKMGVLGEYPVDEMLSQARSEPWPSGVAPIRRLPCSPRCT